ncbi:hypothetical protein TEA_019269 [Camellia sinensis var. sinensis]|uniref:Uncharacterized protein n=1 Tax=Camellia sinensis var. sinensis TaxID=542762 RepID=A0A4S4F2A6_CAMSN|nr:hypothetical protein TEA_019269 [Camellia sinensis var. sinensis]
MAASSSSASSSASDPSSPSHHRRRRLRRRDKDRDKDTLKVRKKSRSHMKRRRKRHSDSYSSSSSDDYRDFSELSKLHLDFMCNSLSIGSFTFFALQNKEKDKGKSHRHKRHKHKVKEFLGRDKEDGVRRSVVSGKKILLKLDKSKEDKLAENNRNELLKFLNASYD